MTHECALYIVATPIGNLSDITNRAISVLKRVDLIAAEDTRHSGRLMQHLDIQTRLLSYHDHSSDAQSERLLSLLQEGKSVALISDAGTPLISDPGYRLVAKARERGIKVVPIPGPCALIAALSASGLATDRFSFEGFPPAKSAGRRKCYDALSEDPRTLVFYESSHRIVESLEDMSAGFGGERKAVIAREISKTYETFLNGSLQTLASKVAADREQKMGEFVVIIEGYEKPKDTTLQPESERIVKVLSEELPLKQAAALTAKITGDKKNRLYQWMLDEQKSKS